MSALAGELVLAADDYGPDNAAWLDARRSGLGASDTAAVLGMSPWATPLSVWLDKTSALPDEAGEAAEWGHALEDPVARMVAKRHPEIGQVMPSPGLLRHDEHQWMLATVDRVLAEPDDPTQVRGLLEIKTTSDRMYRDRWLDGVPPAYYLIQVQQQLAVTGLDRAWIAVLVGGQYLPEPYPVERDETAIESIVTYAGAWWDRYIIGQTQPEPTFTDADRMTAIYPGDTELDAIEADDALRALAGQWLDERRKRLAAEKAEEAAAFEVQKRLGNHTALTIDGAPVATDRKSVV